LTLTAAWVCAALDIGLQRVMTLSCELIAINECPRR